MRRGYMSGLLTGAIVGGLLAVWLAPQMRGNTNERLMQGGRRAARGAQYWWHRGRDAAEDLVDRI